MSMSKNIGLLLSGALLTAGGLAAAGLAARPSRADADPEIAHHRFNNKSIEGSYGFNTGLGYLMPPAAPEPTPTVAIGHLVFDGDGGCQLKNVINIAGGPAIEARSTSCSYSVQPDGTGTAEAVIPGTPIVDPIPVAFVIVDRGREIRFINTRFVVGSFTARRQQ
jgi:hypothetical protein